MTPLMKCCFCLESVSNPIIMCAESHIGCFDCVCTHVAAEAITCATCRQPHSFRFDRLITEISLKVKKRKRTSVRCDVFHKLLALKHKKKHRHFTRCLRKFAMATKTEEDVDNMVEDIHNIEQAHISAKRLKESGVYDAQLYSHIGI